MTTFKKPKIACSSYASPGVHPGIRFAPASPAVQATTGRTCSGRSADPVGMQLPPGQAPMSPPSPLLQHRTCSGRSAAPVGTRSIRSTTSKPSITWPKMVYLPAPHTQPGEASQRIV